MIRYSTFAFFKPYALRLAPWTLYLIPYTLYLPPSTLYPIPLVSSRQEPIIRHHPPETRSQRPETRCQPPATSDQRPETRCQPPATSDSYLAFLIAEVARKSAFSFSGWPECPFTLIIFTSLNVAIVFLMDSTICRFFFGFQFSISNP